jgi:signal transduction histidine kinase
MRQRQAIRGNSSPMNHTETLANGHTYMAVEHRTRDGGIATFYIDITEMRENERALRSAKEQAELARRGKSDFLANISHELRTPLNAIIGFSELIRDGYAGPPDSPRYKEYIGDIHTSGTHLLELINDILDLSKAEAGLLKQDAEETNITYILRESLKLVSPRANKAHLTLSTNIPDDLPLLVIDPKRARQIFLNLLSNAVKFTPEGGTVGINAEVTDDGRMIIEVFDTGIGIAAEDIPKALEAFGQVDSSLARKYEGTGLGLPLTKRLVEGNEGILVVDSEVGRGTTIRLIFPKHRVAPHPTKLP